MVRMWEIFTHLQDEPAACVTMMANKKEIDEESATGRVRGRSLVSIVCGVRATEVHTTIAAR